MAEPTVRAAFTNWPAYQRALRDAVADLSGDALATRPSPERWPLWATVGHLACQRVFWLCDAAGETGADETPFPNAAFLCPGDDDLEHALGAAELAEALDATFRIVDRRLDAWTLGDLAEEIRHPEWHPGWAYTRGSILQRAFAHDVYHVAEVNEVLTALGIPVVDLWD
jgi:hypothetical protein